MSLLLFQAMLFASSAFVSPAVLKNAGYSGVKVARNIFYRRTKLLFDIGGENDAFTRAQAALLLTFQFSAAEPHAGSLWLSAAVQNAIVARVHTFQAPDSSPALRKRNKRLWWSIYWRDRVLTMGLRKPLQVPPSSFIVKIDTLTLEDLKDETHQSVVYDPKTKRHLIEMLGFQCRLGIILTEVLTIAYGPTAFDPSYSLDNFGTTLSQIRTARAKLARWKEEAEAGFYLFLSDSSTHRSLTLFSTILYIYVRAAQIALGNHEAMIIERLQKGVTVLDGTRLRDIGEELSQATTETTRLVRHIVRQGLTQHLPISLIAYIAFPLMLSSLDDKLTSVRTEAETDKTVSQCHAQAMHLCSKRFEGAEDISRMITQILHSTPMRFPLRPIDSGSGSPPAEGGFTISPSLLSPSGLSNLGARWDDIFATRLYLRLRLSLDYALVTGKPPKETDLPSYIVNGGTKRLTWGPVHQLSATMLDDHFDQPEAGVYASQYQDTDARVIELEDPPQNEDIDPALLSNPIPDTLMFDQSNITVQPPTDTGRILRNSWEYDPIWAANLFEEMTDVLWG